MVNIDKLKEWMVSSGIVPGCDTLTFEEHVLCMDSAREVLGEKAYIFLQDCFMPSGCAVEPGYEDSCVEYVFTPESWEEFEADAKAFADYQ